MKSARMPSIGRRFAAPVLLSALLLMASSPSLTAELRTAPDSGPHSSFPDPVTAAACIVGESRVASFLYFGVLEVGDNHYTLVDPASCTACTNGMILLNNARFRTRTASGSPPCPITVETSIVAASLVSGCYAPDTTRVLCQPTTYTLSVTSVNQTLAVPISNGCCIDQAAYIRIRVLDNQCPLFDANNPSLGHWPGLGALNTPCVPCRTYFHSSQTGVMIEGCSANYAANDGISSEADCCDIVPALPRSWGSVKSLYHY